MRIIPAIDIIDGKCVRLKQGAYDQKKIYSENPLEMAQSFEDAGIKYLHVVDLDGAKSHHIVNHKILESIVKNTHLKVDFGGGIKSDTDIQRAFDCGATQVTCGSISVKNPTLVLSWLEKYGADKIILGADVRDQKIAVQGWEEQTDIDIFAFLNDYEKQGMRHCICTDIATDGMMTGPSVALYSEIQRRHPNVKLIASGGVSNILDVAILNEMDVAGVIIGTALYEGNISLAELRAYVD